MKSDKRLHYIDQCKAIGILLIVWGHVSYLGDPISNIASYFKIAIFYIISGYLTRLSDDRSAQLNTGKVIKNKIYSLLIPYFFFSILAIAYFLVRDIFVKKNLRLTTEGLVQTITFRGISTLWFLPTLLMAFILHELFMKVWQKNSFGRLVGILLLGVIPVFGIVTSTNIDLKYECLTANIALFLMKSLMAFEFLEISYILTVKNLNLPTGAYVTLLGGGAYY